MARMRRKQIYIEERQEILLRRLAKRHGLSEAELIRQAVDREARASRLAPLTAARTALADFIEFGKSRTAAPGSAGRTWRRENLYDERLSRFKGSGP
jgi:hypothetical protein